MAADETRIATLVLIDIGFDLLGKEVRLPCNIDAYYIPFDAGVFDLKPFNRLSAVTKDSTQRQPFVLWDENAPGIHRKGLRAVRQINYAWRRSRPWLKLFTRDVSWR
jgi:hypothetical protein